MQFENGNRHTHVKHDKFSFPKTFKVTWNKAVTVENAAKGFKVVGLYLFNPASLDQRKLYPAELTANLDPPLNSWCKCYWGSRANYTNCGTTAKHINCGTTAKHINCGTTAEHINCGTTAKHSNSTTRAENINEKSNTRNDYVWWSMI